MRATRGALRLRKSTMSTLAPLYLPAPLKHGVPAHILRILTMAVVAFVLVAMGAWQAAGWWHDGKAVAALQPHVKLTSVYVGRVLEYQFGEDSNITVGEFIKVTENGLEDIEKSAVTVKAARARDPEAADKAVAYMGESQELLRNLNRLARMQVKIETYREQIDELDAKTRGPLSPSEQRAAREQLATVLKSVMGILNEATEQAESSARHLRNLREQSAWVVQTFGEDSAIPKAILEKASSEVEKSLGVEPDKKRGVRGSTRHLALPVPMAA